jgi:hypothetical protein
MGNDDGGSRAERFSAYLADIASVLGDARRYVAMVSYCRLAVAVRAQER